jgi:alkylation response protein AidB-like acyl-CoA dehydrogenase
MARAAHERFTQLARAAIEKCAADGRALDEPTGAAAALAHIADAALELPLPAAGDTQTRWSALAAVSGVDVALGRLFEAHADAVAILAELQAEPPTPSERWGVWAAEGPASTVTASPAGGGWRLHGQKPWCSGAVGNTHALVTADSTNGRALFAVAIESEAVVADSSTWQSLALTGTATYTVAFDGAPARVIGEPGEYLSRDGFWHGGAGVAAAWWGAMRAVADPLYKKVGSGNADPYAAAHLGAVEVALSSTAALLRETAADLDQRPRIARDDNALRALRARTAVEAAADDVMAHVARALGPGPLSQARSHARAVADLSLYIRQSHAERDLAQVGELAAKRHDEDPDDA